MKKIQLLLFFSWWLTGSTMLLGQVQEVCTDCNVTPVTTLKIHSIAQGVLVPKMTTAERLAIDSPSKGSLIFDTSNEEFWLFNGTTWIAMNRITGPQGIQGNQGPRGPQGIQGPRGAQGKTGPRGIQGMQGIQGAGGAQGPTGIRGPKGRTGQTGPVGPQGIQGASGRTGASGPRGFTGKQGAKGDTGARGPQGIQGPTGPVGTRGYQGLRGDRGPMGHQGPMGLQGFQGLRGSQGVRGPQGPRGVQGPQGISIKGDPGPQGPRGPRGLAGACCNTQLKEELEEMISFKKVFVEQDNLIIAQKAQLEEMNIRLNNMVEVLDNALKATAVIADNQEEIKPTPPVATASLVLEEQASLAQNYPNPFQKVTNIEYYIPAATKEAIIQITNMEGKQIGEVKLVDSGHGLLTVDANTYSTGTFFYTLILDGEVTGTKKMILTK